MAVGVAVAALVGIAVGIAVGCDVGIAVGCGVALGAPDPLGALAGVVGIAGEVAGALGSGSLGESAPGMRNCVAVGSAIGVAPGRGARVGMGMANISMSSTARSPAFAEATSPRRRRLGWGEGPGVGGTVGEDIQQSPGHGRTTSPLMARRRAGVVATQREGKRGGIAHQG